MGIVGQLELDHAWEKVWNKTTIEIVTNLEIKLNINKVYCA